MTARAPYSVLIVQPTIPHYRVPFFNALERLRPETWRFAVTFDPAELTSPRFLQNPLDASTLHFPSVDVKHRSVSVLGKTLTYQTIWRRAGRYDLIIVEHALHDLAYPVCQFYRLRGVRFAYWGHGRDRSIVSPGALKRAAEWLKALLARNANGYFAYTEGVKREMEVLGMPPDKVFALGNTIDINEQRRAFEAAYPRREEIRRGLGVSGKQVLLFVGRFTPNKRIPFLLEAFSFLREMNRAIHLLLIGGGKELYGVRNMRDVSYFGSIEAVEKLAPLYIASDVLAFPGAVGLGPLQALCFDVPVITIDSATHNPEIEYFTSDNSVILPASTTPREYAIEVHSLLSDAERLCALRAGAWPSIRQLTIESMASNFIHGVNTLLGIG